MDNHISFGDLVTFAWMDQLTPETREFALTMNRHLAQCEECQQKLEQLQQIRQQAETLREEKRKRDEAEQRVSANKGKVLPFLGREIREIQTITFCAADEAEKPQIHQTGVIHLEDPEEEKDS